MLYTSISFFSHPSYVYSIFSLIYMLTKTYRQHLFSYIILFVKKKKKKRDYLSLTLFISLENREFLPARESFSVVKGESPTRRQERALLPL